MPLCRPCATKSRRHWRSGLRRLHFGTTLRISREAPIPIVRRDDTENRLGGAANAAADLAALGADTSLVGFSEATTAPMISLKRLPR